MPWPAASKATPEQREAALIKALEGLGPGTWIIIEHPGLDTPEMQAMGPEVTGRSPHTAMA